MSSASSSPGPSAPKVAFISGPIGPSPTYFDIHYAPRIAQAVAQGHHFVVGPSRGIDTLALNYLLTHCADRKRITVFLFTTEASASRVKDLEHKGVVVIVAGRGHTERDEAMTRSSHYDILRYRTESEDQELYGATYRKRVSGTEKNEIRRRDGMGLVWCDEGGVLAAESASDRP